MILTHGANSVGMGNEGGNEQFVTIGEHEYHYIKVNNLYWIDENFKENVGEGVWYGNDPTNEQKLFGRLYPTSGYKAIRELLPTGWRISTENDWRDLLSSYSREDLSSDWWSNGSHPNSIGFNATGCGGYFDTFTWLGTRCIFGYGDVVYKNQNFQVNGDFITGWSGDDSSTYNRQKFTLRIVSDVAT